MIEYVDVHKAFEVPVLSGVDLRSSRTRSALSASSAPKHGDRRFRRLERRLERTRH